MRANMPQLETGSIDELVFNLINEQIQARTKAATHAGALDKKLSATGEAGARNYINTLLQMTEYQDKFFDDINDSNEIISSMLIASWNNYDGTYSQYMHSMPDNLCCFI